MQALIVEPTAQMQPLPFPDENDGRQTTEPPAMTANGIDRCKRWSVDRDDWLNETDCEEEDCVYHAQRRATV